MRIENFIKKGSKQMEMNVVLKNISIKQIPTVKKEKLGVLEQFYNKDLKQNVHHLKDIYVVWRLITF
ncbi:CLUMA_CG018440, isoform A [Clunio marinus]|uniref:CLUMA_CG018440, isoform A n=1 Tax=Clunio marinus TaxID=568069 RepID=A0A1J1J041_9DIPT|nr:CLUMA_CG018440, isoform A [Clunio marinus]